MLGLLLLIPLLGALLLLLVPRESGRAIRALTLGTTGLMLAVAVVIAAGFDPGAGRFDYETSREWIPSLGASFALGIDGIALVLVLLTSFLAPVAAWAADSAVTERKRDFSFWYLVLNFAMVGALVARDAFLFFVFWELMLVPMALIIGIWGGGRRVYASVKFFLYTVVGSLPMLAALLYVAMRHRAETGTLSFLIDDLARVSLDRGEQLWCFAAFALSFAIKMPLWPLHTWLPDAHTEAPTPGSVILAGVLLKMGGYGFLRFALPLFPEAARAAAPLIATLALIAIIAGSLVAMVQSDIKRLVAYSSVAHMGAVMLGIFSLTEEGVSGAVLMMLAHGLSTGALFLLVGFVYERRHTREIEDLGGIAKVMPVFAVCFVVATMASIGLPGLNGFPAEFLILAGAFKASPVYAAFAVTGAILGAWYMLGAVRRVFFGEIRIAENRKLTDLSARELGIIVPVLLAILWMGVRAEQFIAPFRPDVARDVALVAGPEGR